MQNFKATHEKDESSEHDEEKGKKEFEESFEETKDSTPKNMQGMSKSLSHDNLRAKQYPKKSEDNLQEINNENNDTKKLLKSEVRFFALKCNTCL